MKGGTWSISALDLILYAIYTLASVSGLILVKRFLPLLRSAGGGSFVFRKEVAFVGVGAGLYILSFLVWMVIVSRLDLSVAYPIAIGLTLVVSTVAAGLLLGEQLSMVRLAGIVVVLIGVLLVTRS